MVYELYDVTYLDSKFCFFTSARWSQKPDSPKHPQTTNVRRWNIINHAV